MELRRSTLNTNVFQLEANRDEAYKLAIDILESLQQLDKQPFSSYTNRGITYADGINSIPATFITQITKRG